MLVTNAPVSPAAQTAFVRNVPVPDELSLLTSFGTRTVQDNRVNFAEIIRKNRTARYRTFDGRIHVSERDAGGESYVNLLPLSTSTNIGEYERLQVEFARNGGTNAAALVNAIYNDSENLTREVQRRLELAWGDVLSDGKLTINEGGLVGFEADFGVPNTHKVPASVVWSDLDDAKVLTELVAWHDVYVASNGGPAGAIRTSQQVLRLVQRNEEIVAAVHGPLTGKTRVTLDELNDLLASEGLPPFVAPYDYQVDIDGASTRTIPASKVLFTPANLADLGSTTFGLSATALELVGSSEVEMSFEEAPGIVGVVIKEGPPFRQFTFVDAVAMPVLDNAKRLFIGTVL